MRRFVKLFTILFIAISFTANSPLCQEPKDEDLRIFEGKVVSVDVAGSKILVKGVTEKAFTVPGSASITRDIYDIELSDIKAGDYVKVSYYKSDGAPDAVIGVSVAYGSGDSW
jgi:hypothetical protein